MVPKLSKREDNSRSWKIQALESAGSGSKAREKPGAYAAERVMNPSATEAWNGVEPFVVGNVNVFSGVGTKFRPWRKPSVHLVARHARMVKWAPS